MVVDWTDLAARYNTDPATLDPEVLERTDRAIAELHRKRAAGEIAGELSFERQRLPVDWDQNIHPTAAQAPVLPDKDIHPAVAQTPEPPNKDFQ